MLAGADSGVFPVGRKQRSYARHYLHFNRAKAGIEPLELTDEGYTKALQDWPEHALFWSRKIRTQFYLEHPERALNLLAQARHTVPDFPQKQYLLVARTVRGLLRRERLLDAIRVWGSYSPDTLAAEEVAGLLEQRLGEGWEADRFELSPGEALLLNRKLKVHVVRVGEQWLAEFRDLELGAREASPWEALRALIARTRQETRELLQAYTHQLDAAARFPSQIVSLL